MKKKIGLFAIAALLFASCEQSNGTKVGVLQKFSHKTFPCSYYEAQIAFEGGKSDDKGNYNTSQDFKVTDTAVINVLSQHVGDRIVFNYDDNGFAACGESHVITHASVKSN